MRKGSLALWRGLASAMLMAADQQIFCVRSEIGLTPSGRRRAKTALPRSLRVQLVGLTACEVSRTANDLFITC